MTEFEYYNFQITLPSSYKAVTDLQCVNTGEELSICLLCNMIFNSKECLQAHVLSHTAGSYTIIPFSLKVEGNKNRPYESEVVISPVEDGKVSSRCQINTQLKTGPSKFKAIYACSTCGKEFKRNDHLKKHIAVHANNKPFTCLICDKSFSRKDRLKEHCVIHLSNGWACYFCGRMFTQRCILRKHEMIHRGVKPYICELCDTRFSRKNDLVRHSTTHTGEKNYFCEMCGKGFTQKRLVKRHLLVHERKNSQVCQTN